MLKNSVAICLVINCFLFSCQEEKSTIQWAKVCQKWVFADGKKLSIDEKKVGDKINLKKFNRDNEYQHGIQFNSNGQAIFYRYVDKKTIPLKFIHSTWGGNNKGVFEWNIDRSKIHYSIHKLTDSTFTLQINKIIKD